MDELRILSPTAILGYGFPKESFYEGMKRKPHVIAVDAGSTDPGPYYLGAGISFTDRNAVKRDLSFLLPAAIENKIPLIIGTAGGCGGNSHLDWNVSIIKELSKELGLKFKIAIIEAEISKETVKECLKKGKIEALAPAPELTEKDVDDTVRIVAQMGVEPFIKALDDGADVIIAGRAYDPSVFAAFAIKKGFDKGLAIHLGKILECAAIAATPGSGSDAMFGYLRKDEFELCPLSPIRKCTTLSVAAHTLYEKSNPLSLPGPGGTLDLTNTTFEQKTENSVVVKGSRFVPIEGEYTLKLEGVKRVGYRTVSIGATHDPIMISQIDNVVSAIKERVKNNFEGTIENYFLDFKLYGKNATMSIFKDLKFEAGNEIGVVIEAVADTQEQANTICSFARSTMLHFGYEGRKSTAGNLAFPFSPSDFKVGEVFVFNVYHLMKVTDPIAPFKITMNTFDKGEVI